MKFIKERYKRLTIVLVIPLLVWGYFIELEVRKNGSYNWIANCLIVSDPQKIEHYEPKCEAVLDLNSTKKGLINGVNYIFSDMDVILNNGEKTVNININKLQDQYFLIEIYTKDLNNFGVKNIKAVTSSGIIFGSISFNNKYDEDTLQYALEKGKEAKNLAIIKNISFRIFLTLIPLLLYFLASFSLFLSYKILLFLFKYIAHGRTKNHY